MHASVVSNFQLIMFPNFGFLVDFFYIISLHGIQFVKTLNLELIFLQIGWNPYYVVLIYHF